MTPDTKDIQLNTFELDPLDPHLTWAWTHPTLWNTKHEGGMGPKPKID